MANTEKISVTLSPDLAQSINDAVSTGRYASASEVVRAALLNWQRWSRTNWKKSKS